MPTRFTHMPTLRQDGKAWSLDDFVPGQTAFRYDEFERKIGTLYMIQCCEYVKIGVTRDLAARLNELRVGNPFPFSILAQKTIPAARLLITEAWLHQRFAHGRVHGEWFLVGADDVLVALPEAERFARAYARACRDWFQRDRVGQINETF